MKYYLQCNGSGRGDCGEVFDTIETARAHDCEKGFGRVLGDDERPDYTIVTEDEAF